MTAMAVFKTTMFYLAVVLIVVIAIFPFYYAFLTSLKTGTALFTVTYLPTNWDFSNYVSVLTGRTFLRSLANSLFIATTTVVSPTNMHGWVFWDDTTDTPTGTGNMVVGPPVPPLGIGTHSVESLASYVLRLAEVPNSDWGRANQGQVPGRGVTGRHPRVGLVNSRASVPGHPPVVR